MRRRTMMAAVASAVLFAGCFKDVSDTTEYVLKPLFQATSGDVVTPVEGARAFSYDVDTTLWTVASYADALEGIVTLKSDPAERRSEPSSVAGPYSGEASEGTESWIQMRLGVPSRMVVVVDPSSRLYAYTQQAVPQNLPRLFVDVTFKGWKEGRSYKEGRWSFYNEFYRTPQLLACYIRPEMQYVEGADVVAPESGTIRAYAYDADTTAWRIASYSDAVAGIITSKSDPELRRETPTYQAYRQPDSELYGMEVSGTEATRTLMVVVVNERERMYAYTKEVVELAGDPPTFGVVFRPWQELWIADEGGWCVVDERLAPGEGPAERTANLKRR